MTILLIVGLTASVIFLVLAVRWTLVCAHVNAARHPLGGFKCPDCGKSFEALEVGYVNALRTLFSREDGLTRTTEWSKSWRSGW